MQSAPYLRQEECVLVYAEVLATVPVSYELFKLHRCIWPPKLIASVGEANKKEQNSSTKVMLCINMNHFKSFCFINLIHKDYSLSVIPFFLFAGCLIDSFVFIIFRYMDAVPIWSPAEGPSRTAPGNRFRARGAPGRVNSIDKVTVLAKLNNTPLRGKNRHANLYFIKNI